jgi:hypothetical protein
VVIANRGHPVAATALAGSAQRDPLKGGAVARERLAVSLNTRSQPALDGVDLMQPGMSWL